MLEIEFAEAQAIIEQLKTTSHLEKTKQVECMKMDLSREVQKSRRFWKLRCDQILKHEEEMSIRDTDVVLLKARLLALEGNQRNSVCSNSNTPVTGDIQSIEQGSQSQVRWGSPPVEPFSGNKVDQQWEDWLPTLERAVAWY